MDVLLIVLGLDCCVNFKNGAPFDVGTYLQIDGTVWELALHLPDWGKARLGEARLGKG